MFQCLCVSLTCADKRAMEKRTQGREKKKTRLLLPSIPTGGRQRTCYIETKTKAGAISDKWMRLMFVLPARVPSVCVWQWISVLRCKQSVIKDKRQQRANSTRGTEAVGGVGARRSVCARLIRASPLPTLLSPAALRLSCVAVHLACDFLRDLEDTPHTCEQRQLYLRISNPR